MEKQVWLPEVEGLSEQEKLARLGRVAISSPEHLKRWLRDTDRRWLIFDALELVDSLPFPSGVDSLIQLIACYRDHRRAIPTGRTELQENPATGASIEVPVTKGEALEVDELDQVIRYLAALIRKRDPAWRLESIER